jgi:hypothetical protein
VKLFRDYHRNNENDTITAEISVTEPNEITIDLYDLNIAFSDGGTIIEEWLGHMVYYDEGDIIRAADEIMAEHSLYPA